MDVYHHIKSNKQGSVASYIPELAHMPPNLFGISVCSVHGECFGIGDVNQFFSLQSCCKPLNYCLARRLCAEDQIDVHDYVGYEPSGQTYNSFVLNTNGLPHNPMINAGAIMVNSLIKPNEDVAQRFRTIQEFYQMLCNENVGFDNAVFQSEKNNCDRNMSLSYYMRENGAFRGRPTHDDIKTTLELYFQCCSMTINTKMGAKIASCLANRGTNPVTKNKEIEPQIVKDCLALMFSCGMYDYSGQFAFEIGLPAKSGVSGGMLLVIPNICGICIFSPLLDESGNSVKSIEFCKEFTKRTLGMFHIFNTDRTYDIDVRPHKKSVPKSHRGVVLPTLNT